MMLLKHVLLLLDNAYVDNYTVRVYPDVGENITRCGSELRQETVSCVRVLCSNNYYVEDTQTDKHKGEAKNRMKVKFGSFKHAGCQQCYHRSAVSTCSTNNILSLLNPGTKHVYKFSTEINSLPL